MELNKLTNEELVKEFKARYKRYLSWCNSPDGSAGACWDYEIDPVVKEMEKRKIDWESIAKGER